MIYFTLSRIIGIFGLAILLLQGLSGLPIAMLLVGLAALIYLSSKQLQEQREFQGLLLKMFKDKDRHDSGSS